MATSNTASVTVVAGRMCTPSPGSVGRGAQLRLTRLSALRLTPLSAGTAPAVVRRHPSTGHRAAVP